MSNELATARRKIENSSRSSPSKAGFLHHDSIRVRSHSVNPLSSKKYPKRLGSPIPSLKFRIRFSIRSATVFGYSPRIRLDLTVNMLTAHAIKRNVITVFGGDQKRPNIHIEDITDVYSLLIDADKELISGDVFNAGYENHTVMDIANIIKETLKDYDVTVTVKDTTDPRSYHISSAKLRKTLNFVPSHTLQDGILEVAAAFKSGEITDWEDAGYYNIKTMKRDSAK